MKGVLFRHLSIIVLLFLILFMPIEVFSEEYRYYSRGRRDPFIPLVSGNVVTVRGLQSVETLEDLRLEGIIFDPAGKSMALLNGEILKEGEKLYNVEVVKVYQSSISIKLYGQQHTINLIEEGGEKIER